MEDAPCCKHAEREGDDRAGVEREHQPAVEHRAEVEIHDAAEQQARNGEALGVDHQAVDGA
jgi:hypothetical protein